MKLRPMVPMQPAMPRHKCTQCGRYTSYCRRCHHRTYCEFRNGCNVHGQEEPTAAQIRPLSETPRGKLFVAR